MRFRADVSVLAAYHDNMLNVMLLGVPFAATVVLMSPMLLRLVGNVQVDPSFIL